MLYNQRQQDMAVKSGHWPLFRYDPRLGARANPFGGRCRPSQPLSRLHGQRDPLRDAGRLHPAEANRLMNEAESAARSRHQEYTDLAALALPGSATTAAEENKNA